MTRPHICIRPTMVPVEPVLEYLRSGAECCPVCCKASEDDGPPPEPVVLFGWLRFPRLRRQKGLATGILGLW